MKTIESLETACKEYEEDLVLHYYGDNSPNERLSVEHHLSGCQACRRFLDDLRGLLPQMARAEQMPQVFWSNYYRETISKLAAQDEKKPWWRTLFAPMRIWMVPTFGTVAAAVLVVGLMLGKGNLSLFSQSRQPNIPHEILTDKSQLEFFESLDMLESLSKLEAQDEQKTNAPHSDSGRAEYSNKVV
jgi:Putative zinc-finger